MTGVVRTGWDNPDLILPSPVVAESGARPCNEPFVVDGQTVAYCKVWVPLKRLTKGLSHKGEHQVTWPNPEGTTP